MVLYIRVDDLSSAVFKLPSVIPNSSVRVSYRQPPCILKPWGIQKEWWCLGRMKQEELGPQQQMLKDRVCECSVAFNSATPWTVVLQAPLSLEFSRQECWSRLPFPLRVSSQPRDPTCICRWSLHHWATWKTGESQEAVERLAAVWTNSERGRHKGNFSWGGREGKTAISG